MSWSVIKVGKPAAVAAAVKAELARFTCSEPEETIKNQVAETIAHALSAFPADVAVKVEANGSQSVPDYKNAAIATNSLSVRIEPLFNFVE